MTQINTLLLSRPARDDLRSISNVVRKRILDVLFRLKNGEHVGFKPLTTWDGYRRNRQGRYRIIWREVGSEILVWRAAARRDIAYENKPSDSSMFKQSDELDELLEDLEDDEFKELTRLTSPPDEPNDVGAYEFLGGDYADFVHFVDDKFRNSPRLTSNQRDLGDFLQLYFMQPDYSQDVAFVQSSPGTGKTIAAAVTAGSMVCQNDDMAVFFIAPTAVVDEVGRLEAVVQASQKERLFLNTSEGWLADVLQCFSDQTIASDAEELQALKLSQSSGSRDETLNINDLWLHRAFVQQVGHEKDAIRLRHSDRIEHLNRFEPSVLSKKLEKQNQIPIVVAAERVAEAPMPIIEGIKKACFIVDETQDCLQATLVAIRKTQQAWAAAGIPTALCLLGDLNQRITPTGFFWDDLIGQLEISRPEKIEWKRNFRNSQQIARFSNEIWKLADKQRHELKDARSLPKPIDPENCELNGDRVECVRFESRETVVEFIKRIRGRDRHTYSIYEDLRNSIWVLWMQEKDDELTDLNVVVKTASEAKGLELDNCVVFAEFAQPDARTPEELNTLYTLLTRPRQRLLILAVPETLNAIDGATGGLHYIEETAALESLCEANAEVDIYRDQHLVEPALARGNIDRVPHLDGYQVIDALELDTTHWETEFVRNRLSTDTTAIQDALRIVDDEVLDELDVFRMRLLLQRMLGRTQQSLEAVEAQHEWLDDQRLGEFERLIESIAVDFENEGRLLSAHRLLDKYNIGAERLTELSSPLAKFDASMAEFSEIQIVEQNVVRYIQQSTAHQRDIPDDFLHAIFSEALDSNDES